MEAVEEVAEKLWLDPKSELTSKKSFIAGAKWQQERSFTLEQISKNFIGENTYGYFDEYLDYRLNLNNENSEHKRPTFKEWFEQFKKK